MKTNAQFPVLHSLAKLFSGNEVAMRSKSATTPMQPLTDSESARVAGGTDPETEVGNGTSPP